MAANPYWNTMWSNRDQEFYWSGVKHGAIFSAIMVTCVFVVVREAVNDIKQMREEV